MSKMEPPVIQVPRNLLGFSSRGDIRGVQEAALFEWDPNIHDQEGNTPLILASEAGFVTIVDLLLRRFPTLNIDQTNNQGQTALMKAAIQGRIACARLLLRAGADVEKRDLSRGFCALEWSEYVGRTECMHMIKHYMQEPIHKHKTSVVQLGDLQKLTAVATVPLLGDSVETVIPRPRLNSAPIPRLEITSVQDQVHRKHSHGQREPNKRRPKSSMA